MHFGCFHKSAPVLTFQKEPGNPEGDFSSRLKEVASLLGLNLSGIRIS
jgi:hypothetical protein